MNALFLNFRHSELNFDTNRDRQWGLFGWQTAKPSIFVKMFRECATDSWCFLCVSLTTWLNWIFCWFLWPSSSVSTTRARQTPWLRHYPVFLSWLRLFRCVWGKESAEHPLLRPTGAGHSSLGQPWMSPASPKFRVKRSTFNDGTMRSGVNSGSNCYEWHIWPMVVSIFVKRSVQLHCHIKFFAVLGFSGPALGFCNSQCRTISESCKSILVRLAYLPLPSLPFALRQWQLWMKLQDRGSWFIWMKPPLIIVHESFMFLHSFSSFGQESSRQSNLW